MARKTYKLRLIIVVVLFIIIIYQQLKTPIPRNRIETRQHIVTTETTKLVEVEKVIETNVDEDRIEVTSKRRQVNKRFFTILEYTKVWNLPKYCHLKLSDKIAFKNYTDFMQIFKSSFEVSTSKEYNLLDKCDYKNCFFTCDKEHKEKADILMFHDTDLQIEVSKSAAVLENIKKENRKSDQIWLYYDDEPYGIPKKLDELKINWTMSFNTQTEVSYCTYGCYQAIDEEIERNEFVQLMKSEFETRRNRTTWFISNCNQKVRLKFAGLLANHYPLYVTKKCGDDIKENDKSSMTKWIKSCKRDSECESRVFATSKFYLAFESKNCTDYITEKLWRTLHYGMIPVVLQPNKESYERMAPKNSFIHAQDFDYDVKKLGLYLHQVSSNFDLYLKHVEWKNKYQVYFKAEDVEPFRLCELCKKLNTVQTHSYYSSLSSWLDKKCFKDNLSLFNGN